MKRIYFFTLSIVLLFLAGCSTPSTSIPEQVETLQSLSAENRVFALAYSNINGVDGFQEGTDVLISKLVDTNGDGEVSAGDTIIMGQYPANFEANAFADFDLKEHVVTKVIGNDQYQINVIAGGASISWIASPDLEKYIELLNFRTVEIFDNLSSRFSDTLVADTDSLSQPQQAIVRTNKGLPGDNSFIDVDGSAGCLAGTYGVFNCSLADAGRFVDSDGATTQTVCPAGTFQDEAGQTSCKPAPAGTFVAFQAQREATNCAKGYFQDQERQSSCIAAPLNTYVDTEGAVSATACPAGQITLATASEDISACIDPDTDEDGVTDANDFCPDTNLVSDAPSSPKKNRLDSVRTKRSAKHDAITHPDPLLPLRGWLQTKMAAGEKHLSFLATS